MTGKRTPSAPCFLRRGEGREISREQCWSLQSNGGRCAAPAAPPAHFCAAHLQRGGGANPPSTRRAPEAEMPPELVARIRRAAPGATFPHPEPEQPATSENAAPAAPPAASATALSTPAGLTPPAPSEHPPCPEAPLSSPAPLSASSVSPCLRVRSAGTDWLLALLQEAMTELMAGDATPLRKANTLARLAALYLKAARAAELEQANAALVERVAAAEAYTADLEARATVWAERLDAERGLIRPIPVPDEDALVPTDEGAPVSAERGPEVPMSAVPPVTADADGASESNGRRPDAARPDPRAPT